MRHGGRVFAAAVAFTLGAQLLWGQARPPEIAAAPAATRPASDASVPVRRVVLFSSGVGYFEHFGRVKDDGRTELRFKTNQINDILKSLIMEDLDGGKVSTITYASQGPLARTLKSFQVDITRNPGMGELLNQLRGARVRVTLPGEKVDAVIVGLEVEEKSVGMGSSVEVWVLNLMVGSSLRSVELKQVQNVELEDPRLQSELSQALAALSQARDQDKKPVTISFAGQGERRVRVGYVVETPIWKSSYRLVLGRKEKAALQGWAIVENQTDNDWTDVQLSLVSGRPISFIQDLYQPLFVPRPVVQPKLYASLRPQTYEEAQDETKPIPAEPARHGRRSSGGSGQGMFGSMRAPGEKSAEGKPDEAEPMDPTASVASVASAAQIGELFEYTVGNVTLPRQRSAMIPIITEPVDVDKLSIYNRAVLENHPLNGARVRNTTKKHLLAGPVTVLDAGNYAGDASIDNLPPGQQRLISYGVDLGVLVNSAEERATNDIVLGKLVKGVLLTVNRMVRERDYVLQNKSDLEKTVLIEHPRAGTDWTLGGDLQPAETTDGLYRIEVKVPSGKKVKFTVQEEGSAVERIELLPGKAEDLALYLKVGKIAQPVRDALAKAISLKQQMAETVAQVGQRRGRIREIGEEQVRIRENIRNIPANSQYYTRLLTKLNDQESEIEKLQADIAALTQLQEKQRLELEAYVNGLSIGEN